MPVTHELSRTAAALGTALALVMLPVAGTIAPANAGILPSPSAEAEASSSADPDGSPEGGEAASAAGEATDSVTADSDSENSKADDTAGDDPEAPKDDPACDPEDAASDADAESGGDEDNPCAVEDPLDTTWNAAKQTITISASEDMPESWANVPFKGPGPDKRRPVAPQTSSESGTSSDATADGGESNDETDDSGNPVPSAASEDVPTEFMLNQAGEVVDADHPNAEEGMEFTHFEEDPGWTFKSDGEDIIVAGDQYTEDGNGGDAASANDDQNADGTVTADDSGTANDSGTNNAEATDDGANKDPSNDANLTATTDSESSDDGTEADSSTGDSSDSDSTSDSESTASSDSNSSDSAEAEEKDADKSDSA
ncbi:MAG: hypothetical protein L0G36_07905, partial [Brevibacterium sp.]|nr:hypothetical protein [Brevibacterium sp.]